VQLDLFGDEPARRKGPTVAERAAWLARFERRWFEAPYDTASRPAGTPVHGWVCPSCGEVEWSGFTLSINHGYDPDVPARVPQWFAGAEFGDACNKKLRRSEPTGEAAA
jgi:hypothetical protein